MSQLIGSVLCGCAQEIDFFHTTEVTQFNQTEIITAIHPGNPNVARMRHDFTAKMMHLDTPELATFMALQLFRAQLRNPCKSYWHKMHSTLREMDQKNYLDKNYINPEFV